MFGLVLLQDVLFAIEGLPTIRFVIGIHVANAELETVTSRKLGCSPSRVEMEIMLQD